MVGFSWPCDCCNPGTCNAYIIGGIHRVHVGGSIPPRYDVHYMMVVFDMNNEVWCTEISAATTAGYYSAAGSDNVNVYYAGGIFLSYPEPDTHLHSTKYEPATDLFTQLSGLLSGVAGSGGVSDHSTQMFVMCSPAVSGGDYNGNRMDFATQSISVSGGTLQIGRRQICTLTQGFDKGYWCGSHGLGEGQEADFAAYSLMDKMDFASGTSSAAGSLVRTTIYQSSVSATAEFGFVYGGRDFEAEGRYPHLKSIEKVTYSTDSSSMYPTEYLLGSEAASGVGDWYDYAFFMGGFYSDTPEPDTYSKANNKLDLATDTFSASTSMPYTANNMANGVTVGIL